MRAARRLIIVLILLTSGCTSLPEYAGHQGAEELAAHQQFARALAALTLPDPADPDFPAVKTRRDNILKQMQAYETEVTGEAIAEAAQGNWAKAFERLDRALTQLPPSSELVSSHARLLASYQQQKSAMEFELDLARAEWLRQNLAITQASHHRHLAASLLRQDIEQWRQDASLLAESLGNIGETALSTGDIALAKRTLPLALQLTNTSQLQRANQRLREIERNEEQLRTSRLLQAEQQRRERESKSQQELQQRQFRETLESCEQALATKDLVRAQQLFARLQQSNKDDERLPALRTRIQQEIQSTIARHHAAGVKSYSQGAFEQAISQWRQVLALDPDNEVAKTHIGRAERVLTQLKRLRGKQHSSH